MTISYSEISNSIPVYDFKYFQGLPFGLFEYEDL